MWLLFPSAQAADVIVAHEGPLLADGVAEHVVWLQIPGISPTDKLKLRGRAKVLSQQILEGDLIKVVLQPKPVERPVDLVLQTSVKGNIVVNARSPIPVVPRAGGSLAIGFEPPIATSDGAPVTVTLRSEGNAHLPAKARDIQLRATAGTLGPLSVQGDSWTASYTPPKVAEPVGVLFTAADWTAPGKVYGFGTLPVSVKRTLKEADVDAGATLKVSDRTLTPTDVSIDGEATFELDLLPSDVQATLTFTNKAGKKETRDVALNNGAVGQFALAPLPQQVKLPLATPLHLRAAVTTPAGAPAVGVKGLQLTGPGDPAITDHEDGWYSVDIDPKALKTWYAMGHFANDSSRVDVTMLDPETKATVTVEPAALVEKTREVTITTEDGLVVLGAEPHPKKEPKDGVHIYVPAEDKGDIRVAVHPVIPPTGLPAVRLELSTPARRVEPEAVFPVTIVARDAYGRPAHADPVEIDGQTVELVDGYGHVWLTAPLARGLLPLAAKSGQLQTFHPVLVGAGPELYPVSLRAGDAPTAVITGVPKEEEAPPP